MTCHREEGGHAGPTGRFHSPTEAQTVRPSPPAPSRRRGRSSEQAHGPHRRCVSAGASGVGPG